jgi:hypothetical protein
MSDQRSTQTTTTHIDSREGVRRLVSWGARAALASPFVAVFGVAVGASIYSDDVSEVAGSGRFTVATATALIALILLGLALVSLYLQQHDALGPFGTAAFVLALVGTMLAAGGAWDQVFTVPYLANEAPAVLDAETSGSLLAGFFVSFALLAAGWALFAIATRRAGVLPRRGSTVLLVGAVLAFLPAPTALRLLVLTIGAALLARAAAPRAARTSPALAVIGALLVAGCGGDDRLSKEETARELNEALAATSGEIQRRFHPVFQQLEGMRDNARVPARVRAGLEEPASAVARELRETADRVDELDPPKDAEDAVDSLAQTARAQAARLEQLPERGSLTVGELAGAVAPPTNALRKLGEAGVEVQPPAQGAG